MNDFGRFQPPVVLSLSGHDPTGGAGVQADIETLFRLQCHPCTVITALTEQDTANVRRVYPQDPSRFLDQALTLLDDLTPSVIKIGLLGSGTIASAVAEIVKRLPNTPVVLDPILAAGGGTELAIGDLEQALRSQLIPLSRLVTPNTVEARRLSGKWALDDCAGELLALGSQSVLITGTHDESEQVVNRLYQTSSTQMYQWPRLPAVYHGSGCTLAAAAAAFLARGSTLEEAVASAQAFTWDALQAGYSLGRGQMLPNRSAGSP